MNQLSYKSPPIPSPPIFLFLFLNLSLSLSYWFCLSREFWLIHKKIKKKKKSTFQHCCKNWITSSGHSAYGLSLFDPRHYAHEIMRLTLLFFLILDCMQHSLCCYETLPFALSILPCHSPPNPSIYVLIIFKPSHYALLNSFPHDKIFTETKTS